MSADVLYIYTGCAYRRLVNKLKFYTRWVTQSVDHVSSARWAIEVWFMPKFEFLDSAARA